MKLAFPATCVPTRTTGIGMKKLLCICCFFIFTSLSFHGMAGQKTISRLKYKLFFCKGNLNHYDKMSPN